MSRARTDWISDRPIAAVAAALLTSAAAVTGGIGIGVAVGDVTAPTIVASEAGRSLDTAVREDLDLDGVDAWHAYGARVRAEVTAHVDAGADPRELTVDDDGAVDRHSPGREPRRITPAPADAPPPADTAHFTPQRWNCSAGLPVTISRPGQAQNLWLTAAHCLPVDVGSTEPEWSSIFGGDYAGPRSATGPGPHLDYGGDYAVTRYETGPPAARYTGMLPPVRGMKVCADTIHGWRCGAIRDMPTESVVRSTTYATPGDSGSIAGVGGAAVYVLAWTDSSLGDKAGAAMGTPITHIRDTAAAHGWTLDVGWANE